MSRLLVDTHALLWWLDGDEALSAAARATIADPENEPLVSTATLWEIAIKRSVGKLKAPEALPAAISDGGFGWLPVAPSHAWMVRDLPFHHRDPFDRLLVAQALVEEIPVVTADQSLAPYGIELLW